MDNKQPISVGAERANGIGEADSMQRMARLLRENEAVTAALWDYHHALDTRQHGGVAADKMVKAVEAALGKPWKQGATLKEPSAELTGGTGNAASKQD